MNLGNTPCGNWIEGKILEEAGDWFPEARFDRPDDLVGRHWIDSVT